MSYQILGSDNESTSNDSSSDSKSEESADETPTNLDLKSADDIRTEYQQNVGTWPTARIQSELDKLRAQLRALGGDPDAVGRGGRGGSAGRAQRTAARKAVAKNAEVVSGQKQHCFCKGKYPDSSPMICCDNCDIWYHMVCVNTDPVRANKLANYVCTDCKKAREMPHTSLGGAGVAEPVLNDRRTAGIPRPAPTVRPPPVATYAPIRTVKLGANGPSRVRKALIKKPAKAKPMGLHRLKSQFSNDLQRAYLDEIIAENWDATKIQSELTLLKAKLRRVKEEDKMASESQSAALVAQAQLHARAQHQRQLEQLQRAQLGEERRRKHKHRKHKSKHRRKKSKSKNNSDTETDTASSQSSSSSSSSSSSGESTNSDVDNRSKHKKSKKHRRRDRKYKKRRRDSVTSSSSDSEGIHISLPVGRPVVRDDNALPDKFLIETVKKLQSDYKLSQKRIASDAGLTGGSTCLSSWLAGRRVHMLPEKELQLRRWITKFSDAKRRELQRTTKKMSKAIKKQRPPSLKKGSRVDVQSARGIWCEAEVTDTETGQMEVTYQFDGRLAQEWLATKSNRLAPFRTHTRSPTSHGGHRHGHVGHRDGSVVGQRDGHRVVVQAIIPRQQPSLSPPITRHGHLNPHRRVPHAHNPLQSVQPSRVQNSDSQPALLAYTHPHDRSVGTHSVPPQLLAGKPGHNLAGRPQIAGKSIPRPVDRSHSRHVAASSRSVSGERQAANRSGSVSEIQRSSRSVSESSRPGGPLAGRSQSISETRSASERQAGRVSREAEITPEPKFTPDAKELIEPSLATQPSRKRPAPSRRRSSTSDKRSKKAKKPARSKSARRKGSAAAMPDGLGKVVVGKMVHPRRSSTHSPPSTQDRNAMNDSFCSHCTKGGMLICCDNCPKAFHGRCLKPPVKPENLDDADWYCLRCIDSFGRVRVFHSINHTMISSKLSPLKSELESWLTAHPDYVPIYSEFGASPRSFDEVEIAMMPKTQTTEEAIAAADSFLVSDSTPEEPPKENEKPK
eukprot:179460_1